MLSWRPNSAGAFQDAAKQMCSAALNGSDHVRNDRVQNLNRCRICYPAAISEALPMQMNIRVVQAPRGIR